MSFSEHLRSGFALAATIAKDSGADKARAGLAPSSLEELISMARELATLPKAQRRARVRALMSPTTLPAPTRAPRGPQPPLRALALLQHRVALSDDAQEQLRSAPLPRPGFTPDPRLLALLQRVAGRAWGE